MSDMAKKLAVQVLVLVIALFIVHKFIGKKNSTSPTGLPSSLIFGQARL